MKHRLIAIATSALLFTAALGVSPALAATDSGSLSCSHGATIAVKGEQQRLDTLTIKANGGTLASISNSYTVQRVSNATSGSWSPTSNSLLFSGSDGWCNPAVSR